MTTPGMSVGKPISTERLDLVLLTAAWLRAFVQGEPLPELGFADPDGFLSAADYVVGLRVGQLAREPTQVPWLLRAIVVRERGVAVGYSGFHAPPDGRGMVEIGYQVLPVHRRRGYASEAAQGMWEWAARHGARVLRASIAPDNVPSLLLVRRAGFVEVGEQIDEIDGLELVFEKPVEAAAVNP